MYPPLPKDAKSKAKIAPKKIQEVKLLNDIRYSLLFFTLSVNSRTLRQIYIPPTISSLIIQGVL